MFFKVSKKYLFRMSRNGGHLFLDISSVLFVTEICLKIVSNYKLQWCVPEASEQSCIQAFERLQIMRHKKFLKQVPIPKTSTTTCMYYLNQK